MSHEKKLHKFKTYENLNNLEKLREEFNRKISKVPPTMEYVRNLILDAKMLFRIVTDPDFDLKEEAREDFLSADRILRRLQTHQICQGETQGRDRKVF